MKIISGIGARSALSIEACWDPELAENILILVCVTG